MKETLIDLGKSLAFVAGILAGCVVFTVVTSAYPYASAIAILLGGWMGLFWMYRKKRELESKS